MSKSYKSYCKKAIVNNPKVYRCLFNYDGSKKSFPKMFNFGKKKTLEDELKEIKKDGWKPEMSEDPKPKVVIIKAERKQRKIDLTIWEMPKNPDRKLYNKIWMHNSRIKQYIKKLKK